MKLIVQICRVLVGLLFVFSGLIKANDPTGFSYKLEEYFSVFAADLKQDQDSLHLIIQDSVVSSAPLRSGDTTYLFTAQSAGWLTFVSEDTLSPDTTLKGNFTCFLSNQTIFKADIGGDTTFQYRFLLNSEIISEGNISIVQNEEKQFEQNIKVRRYLKADSFWVGFFHGVKKYALFLSIFISVIEILLGFGLLIGWNPRLIGWLLMAMILFFTFLTWYSATYNKVTDCGCFGDAIPLTPYQSFYKDLILFGLLLIILIGARRIKPLFSNMFSINFLAFITIISTSIAIYCKYYLPVKNFLKFKPGNDIQAMMKTPPDERKNDHIIVTYIYKNADGKEQKVIYDSEKKTFTPQLDYSKWTYDRIESEKIIAEAYKPPVHDFRIQDAERNENFTDSFFNHGEYKLLIVMHDITKVNLRAVKKINKLAADWQALGYPVWALTGSSSELAEKFRHEQQLSFPIHYGDDTQLKSIIRSNPGLVLFTDKSVVKETWPSTKLPKIKKLQKLTGK
jgi:uncharacterized membrane protein YphA (DoxX/SURF4 family)